MITRFFDGNVVLRVGLLFVTMAVMLTGCKTTTSRTEPGSMASAEALNSEVDLSLEENTLGSAVRRVGEEIGGGLVSVHGLEERPVPTMNFQNDSYGMMVERMADAADSLQVKRDYYYLIYPPGYDILLEHDLEGSLPTPYRGLLATLAVGGETKLFNALAMLSDSLDITVVADNAVAEAITGELTLEDAPLYAVLEALLQSSLAPPQDINIEATEEYILLRSRDNQHPETLLQNGEALSASQRDFLDQRIDLTLPRPNNEDDVIAFYLEATTLGQVLDTLASQLGVSVHVEQEMRELPINYSIMHNVRVETALDLIIRQWLVPRFGYTLEEDGIHFQVI